MKLGDFQHLWEHAQDSAREGALDAATHSFSAGNPSCGDDISIELLVSKKGIIQDAAFTHTGCTLSYAAASAFLDHIIGKKLSAAKRLPESAITKLLNMPISKARQKCATLVLETIKK